MAVALAGAGLLLLALLALAYFVAPAQFAPDLTATDLSAIPRDQWLAARNDRLATQNQIRATSLQLVGGIVVLGGAIAAWYQVQLRRDDQQIAREGQITERFTRAIEQLGNADSLDIRLGGIHALGRIAKDSDEDRPAVIAVLAAFIRRKAPVQLTTTTDEPSLLARPAPGARSAADRPQDARAATDALSQALARTTEAGQYLHVNLRAANVAGIDLVGANLTGADLTGADLTGADLTGADLTGASLTGADLPFARLNQANLTGADLSGAYLSGADLRGAGGLTGADLTGADLTGADLTTEQRAKLRQLPVNRTAPDDEQS